MLHRRRLQITADHHPSEQEGAFQAVEAGLVGRRGSLLRPAGYSDNCTRLVAPLRSGCDTAVD